VVTYPAGFARIGQLREQPIQLNDVENSHRDLITAGSTGRSMRDWHKRPFERAMSA
jgi:hypothetical protein